MIIRADARFLPMQDACVDCVVTSPPYFGLRDYGTAGQIGLEPSPDAYVANMVAVFSEVRRVLVDEGTVWLNLGDSYAGVGAQTGGTNSKETGKRAARMFKQRISWRKGDGENGRNGDHCNLNGLGQVIGLKSKDLVGIPWRVAFALQADGWYLRSDVIWSKPNPMPESVTDRPTKSHEYIFLLAKSERYYYDAKAIAEPVSLSMLDEVEQGYDGLGLKQYEAAGVQNPSSVKARIIANARRKNEQSGDRRKVGFNDRLDSAEAQRKSDAVGINGRNVQATNPESERRDELGTFNNNPRFRPNLTRNRRSVWTIPTMPYAGAHFATMPEALVEPCILAGCPLGGLVLDPFVGSGTVVAVAQRLGRRGVGVDLSYHDLAKERTAQRGLSFTA